MRDIERRQAEMRRSPASDFKRTLRGVADSPTRPAGVERSEAR
jgi:hypothetical protein